MNKCRTCDKKTHWFCNRQCVVCDIESKKVKCHSCSKLALPHGSRNLCAMCDIESKKVKCHSCSKLALPHGPRNLCVICDIESRMV